MEKGYSPEVAQKIIDAVDPPVAGVVLFNRTNCEAFNDDALKEIIALKPDIVLMEGAWWFYRAGPGEWDKLDMRSLRQTVQRVLAAMEVLKGRDVVPMQKAARA